MTASTRSLLTGALTCFLLAPALAVAQDSKPSQPPSGKTGPTANPSLHAPLKIRVLEGKTKIPITFLLEAWGQASQRRVSYSPSVAGLQLQLSVGVHELSRAEVLRVLARVDVTVLESEQDLFALGHRELSTKIGTEVTPHYSGDDAVLPELNQAITWTCTIKHGAGSAIYANLRGILARDPTRAGNILYIQGPEKLILTDLAPRIRYYRGLIRALDVKSVESQIVTLYRAPTKVWDALKTKPVAEIAKALRANEQAVRLEEVRSTGSDLSLKQNAEMQGHVLLIKLQMLTEQSTGRGGSPYRIKVSVTDHSERGDFQAELDFVSPRSGPGAATGVSFQGGQERLIVVVTPAQS